MNVTSVLEYQIPPRDQAYTSRDVILYALGVGLGADPLDERQLPYVYEQSLKVLPTYAMVLAHPGFWLNDPVLGLDWVNVLHTEQYLSISRPIAPAGRIASSYRINAIVDRGVERGANLYFEKILADADTGEEVARVISGVLCRKDGGCGNHGTPPQAAAELPTRAPDRSVDVDIPRNAALIYRLSGDVNPLHVDPAVARKAGFERPILHGLCTMGIAAQVLTLHAGDGAGHITDMSCRFTKPVYPGDRVIVQIWNEPDRTRFQVLDAASGKPVLGRGEARLER